MKKLITVCQVLVFVAVASFALAEYWDWNADRIVGNPTVIVDGNLSVTGGLTVAGSSVVDNGSITSISWDCVTSRPTINGTTVTGAVLDNASKYPTLNQTTTGTAAGLTNQYINWNSSSGGSSVSNRPTINGVTVTGVVLDNASNYPAFNQNTTGTAANVTGIVAVANGGTGADNAATARSNLGTNSATNITAGTLAEPWGGWGESIASATGHPYLDNGSVIWDTIVALLARGWLIYNPADNSYTFPAEIIGSQFVGSGAANTHFINVADNTAPNVGTETVGDCYYDNIALVNKCWGGSSWDNVGSGSGSLADNSITPAKLQSSSGTRNSTSAYFGDGHWGVPAGTSSINIVGAAPGSPSAGDIWFLTTDNVLYIRGTGGTFNTAALTWVVDGGTPPTDFTDDFTRASIGATYTLVTDLVALAISSNQLAGTDAITTSSSYRNDFTGGDNAYVSITVIDNTDPCGVYARVQTGAKTYYRFGNYAGASTLERVVAGSATELAAGGANFATNDNVMITSTGSNPVVVKGWINGVEVLTYSDSAAGRLTGGYPGWHILGLTGRLDSAAWGVYP